MINSFYEKDKLNSIVNGYYVIPCPRFLWSLLKFQHMVRPIVVHDSDILPTKPFVCHLNHICCQLTRTECSHHFLHVKFAPYAATTVHQPMRIDWMKRNERKRKLMLKMCLGHAKLPSSLAFLYMKYKKHKITGTLVLIENFRRL